MTILNYQKLQEKFTLSRVHSDFEFTLEWRLLNVYT